MYPALGLGLLLACMTPAVAAPLTTPARLEDKRGQVNYTKPPASAVEAPDNQALDLRDRLHVGESSWAIVRFRDASEIKVRELTQIEIVEPTSLAQAGTFRILNGAVYFSGLRRSREIQVQTAHAQIRPKGTEFLIRVSATQTEVVMFDGEAALENDLGVVTVQPGELGVAVSGSAPRIRAAIEATNVVQWWLYYPAVLAEDDLLLTPQEQALLQPSLAAYRSGDLPSALVHYPGYPTPAPPAADGPRIYLAELLLSIGAVDKVEALLQPLRPGPGVNALRRLIAAVTRQGTENLPEPASPSEWLAISFQEQSAHRLEAALTAARNATRLAPTFAFAWEQVAELEFGFGRSRTALAALERVLELAPRHAQAHALRGFLLSAENHVDQALDAFNTAITIDPGLGNARLGRGLVRIRRREFAAGLEDLQTAILLEPNRALLHSYLGKAYAQVADAGQARKELAYARHLDPNDPTPWLYEALAAQEENRINSAVRGLERSRDLNDNRQVYRSGLLLDQDRAVREAHLASIHQDAGLPELSVEGAARSLAADYANYSAHLFLADSYNALRDPRQFNLRYETPWLSEYLVGNLLAPVSAGSLAPGITPQEYSRFFDHDGFGLSSLTEYRSEGAWRQAASQFGRSGNTAYALDAYYSTEDGHRANNDFEQFTGSLKIKHQLTAQDGFYVQALYYSAEGGDLRQYYDEGSLHRDLRVEEHQEPLLLAGYHREWSPGAHTLLLASRWDDTVEVRDPEHDLLLEVRDPSGNLLGVAEPVARLNYRSVFEGYSVEGQQIQRAGNHTAIAGARWQRASFPTKSFISSASVFVPEINFTLVTPALGQHVAPDLERRSVYAYDYWQVAEPLLLTAGLTYDWLELPENHRSVPLGAGEDTREQLSPKAGFVLSPWTNTTVRGAYARGLGGVSFDRSFQLEPAQVAGFAQSYRSLVPDSAVGSTAGGEQEVAGFALDQRMGRNTYLTAAWERLREEARRDLGTWSSSPFSPTPTFTPSSLAQNLDYREESARVSLSHLLGERWLFGAGYRWSEADLHTRIPRIAPSFTPVAVQDEQATLHRVNFFARFFDPSGFFASFDSIWSLQSNHGYTPAQPGDDFWQLNLHAGYRFARRRAELALGVLNLTDQTYRWNPLNLTDDLPRERVFTVTLRFSL